MSLLEMNSIVDLLISLWPQETWEHVNGLLGGWRERLDDRDNYSGHHSGLASEYAIQLANRQDLPFDAMAALWVAGHVYDLGKISVPEHVLVKRGPLSSAETLMLRNHVSTGYDLLRDWDVLRVSPRWMSQVVLEVVLFHHERWDGDGYPKGLREDSIPLPARIMTISDAFAAMIMDTPYRDARSEDVALRELEQHAGTQFDPYLVRSFVSLVRVNRLTGRGPTVPRRPARAAYPGRPA
jgi:HD-GYP domain-containing protein (c-di-GMP phosphodiesterase class II)